MGAGCGIRFKPLPVTDPVSTTVKTLLSREHKTLFQPTQMIALSVQFKPLVYLSFTDEKILLLFAVYYLVVFMNNYSSMLSLFDSQSDEDAGIDDDGADTPSVVLPAPATPAPLVASAASAAPPAPPAIPLVQEVNDLLPGQYFFIIIVNINSILPVISVCFYRH